MELLTGNSVILNPDDGVQIMPGTEPTVGELPPPDDAPVVVDPTPSPN
ncbi:MAG TPA: hypothetical protein VJC17_03385 [Candidatus Dojkabacteria bacterium]|nr:hypothetical protein [Candidatus Dojkabacteria bacterium]